MENNDQNAKSIGDRMYSPEDYDKTDEYSSGLAQTHEQANDAYAEGTIDGKVERESGKAEDISKKGFDE